MSDSEASQILSAQREINQKLEQIQTNVKKTNLLSRTADLQLKKRTEVRQLWANFSGNHTVLLKELQEDHPYFPLYEEVQQMAENILKTLEKWDIPKPTTEQSEEVPNVDLISTTPRGEPQAASWPDFSYQPLNWASQPQQNMAQQPLFLNSPNYRSNLPKLPTIQIPKFSGNWKEWQQFHDMFINVIDKNFNLAPVEKMQYLLNYLDGEPKRMIAHLHLNNENYAPALQLIQARYKNNRKIVTSYIETILQIKKSEYRSSEDIINILDTLRECLQGLRALQYDINSWDPLVVCIILKKLDSESLRYFEEGLNQPREMPTLQDLMEFLEKRHQILECLKENKPREVLRKKSFASIKKPYKSCSFCQKEGHLIFQCLKFKEINPNKRFEFINENGICPNCLSHDKREACYTKWTCFKCPERHNTLLHDYYQPQQEASAARITRSHLANKEGRVLLATAMVKVINQHGQHELLKALIDPGSQSSFITETAAQLLRLPKQKSSTIVTGIGGKNAGKISYEVDVNLAPRFPSNKRFNFSALILPKLTSLLPEQQFTLSGLGRFGNLILADPLYNKPSSIDLILGASVYAEIIDKGLHKLNSNQIILQNTEIGWIITGMIPPQAAGNERVSLISIAELDNKLTTFWEIDEQQTDKLTKNQVDEFFEKTTKRNSEGRYIVQLPVKEEGALERIGSTKPQAIARLISLEKTFKKDPELANDYRKFLEEYEKLGHMTRVEDDHDDKIAFYLPHHAVKKEQSTTTKLRVVFNASAKSQDGISLNDALHPGYKIQQDITQILIRWRKYRFVFTADVEKMFRQILVAPEHRSLQRILWRNNCHEPITTYDLNTVTYGTAPATYLAVKTLMQLANDERNQFPLGSKILERDFYVDDMLTGSATEKEALEIQIQTSQLLQDGGFNLRKWTSNHPHLLSSIPLENQEAGDWQLQSDVTVSTLGISWNPQKDEFQIKLKPEAFTKQNLTKRQLLSQIATIFDPLGFLAPINLSCKIWMQQLWMQNTGWDELISPDIQSKWSLFIAEIDIINEIKIPRWIHYNQEDSVELHGFCDASEKAYAAVIYARTTDKKGNVHITLLTAKTKVAPLKNRLTLPKMELAGALLLARLMNNVIKALEIERYSTYLWCDSMITLAWIQKDPTNWQTFVANRVAEIQNLTRKENWRYVQSEQNPADVSSRGCSPLQLKTHHLWWTGPQWLINSIEKWPLNKDVIETTKLEMRRVTATHAATPADTILHRFSSFNCLIRTTAWIMRFKNNCQKTKEQRMIGFLSSTELNAAKSTIMLQVQMEVYPNEVIAIRDGKQLPKSSPIISLNPCMGKDGVLRVGGRLQHSNLSFQTKHPIILPKRHYVTTLIIEDAHKTTLHGGGQLTLNYIKNNYWLINGRSLVQSTIRKCVKCARFASTKSGQLMGDLPLRRITPASSFTYTGIDYAGPFKTRCSKGRGIKTTKSYISLFICFTTKAIHLELVSDLSTDAFIAAYKRFTARRGRPLEIYSDNGTNFVGARTKLDKDLKAAIKESANKAACISATDGTDWKFNPVASPHFGGLWEAGVKSVKHHLKRVLGETTLTFEEFSTVLCEIEACLNSRPITQLSSDPTSLEALTPGHFLITRPLLAPPEADQLDTSLTNRWKLLSKLNQDLWKRWSKDYLTQLQQRTKWKVETTNQRVGDLVLLKEKDQPPTKWALGRIHELHPGEDGKVRLVSIRTKNNHIKKQPLSNLCLLPVDHEDSQLAQQTHQTKPIAVLHTTTRPAKDSGTPKHSKTNTGFQNIWYASMLFALLCPAKANLTMYTPKSGFYIEKLGQTQLQRGTLRLQVIFKIDNMEKDKANIDEIYKNLTQLQQDSRKIIQESNNVYTNNIIQPGKEQTTDLNGCARILDHFLYKRNSLFAKIEKIKELSKIRTRRGMLGKLLTTVFGVNDEVYTDLNALHRDQSSLSNMMNQQVLQLNTKMEQGYDDSNRKLQLYGESINKVIAVINNSTIALNWERTFNHLLITHTSAMNYLEEVEDKYQKLARAVLDKDSIMEIISLQNMHETIQNATSLLPNSLYIRPLPEDRTEIETTADKIIISGFFPIAAIQQYELLHITPIPHLHKDVFLTPNLPINTIAVNYNDQTYFGLDEYQLASCHSTSKSNYICNSPIVNNLDAVPSCVIDEIYNRSTRTPCELVEVNLTGILWKKLIMENTWLFITKEQTEAAIMCSGVRQDIMLKNIGIVKLNEGCHLKTRMNTISSYVFENLRIVETFNKPVIPNLYSSSPRKQITMIDPAPISIPTQRLMTSSIDMTILGTTPKILTYHITSASVSILVTLALVACIWKRRLLLRQHKRNCKVSRRHSAPTISSRFDKIIASAGPQNV